MMFDFPRVEEAFASPIQMFPFDYPRLEGKQSEEIEEMIYNHFKSYQLCIKSPLKWINYYFAPRMNEIMPMFNKLYETADLIVEPLTNRNYTIEKSFTETESTTGSKDSTSAVEKADATSGYNNANYSNTKGETVNVETGETVEGSNGNTQKFSDTPQGAVSNLTDGYLTNVTLNNGTNEESTSGTSATEKEGTENSENRENFLTANSGSSSKTDSESTTKENEITHTATESIVGYDNTDVAKLLEDYRRTLIDINTKLIEALADMFLQVYDLEAVFDDIFGETTVDDSIVDEGLGGVIAPRR